MTSKEMGELFKIFKWHEMMKEALVLNAAQRAPGMPYILALLANGEREPTDQPLIVGGGEK